MELVTGRAGTPHITSQQDRQRNQGTFGDGAYILKTGNQLDPVVQSSNKIQIKDGALMFQGALFSVKVGTVDEVTIANGSQGMQRKDLIVARYTYDAGENVESAAWAVIQGTPAASNPVTPEYTEGDIQAGDTTVECPVFIVTLDGINITGVEMVPEIAPDVPEIMAQLEELNSNIKNNAGIIAYMKYIALSFHTSDTLQTWLKDVPDDIFVNPSNYTVALSMREQGGTPYSQVSKMTYEIRTNTKQFVVNAYGSGFVSGHQLDVSVTIFKTM